MFQNVIVAWFARRALELGGIFGILWTIYSSLPPTSQNAIERLLAGEWQGITLGALVPIGLALWGYLWSFFATVQPQVVTTDAKKIPLPKKGEQGVSETRKVEAIAEAAPNPKTLAERIGDVFRRR